MLHFRWFYLSYCGRHKTEKSRLKIVLKRKREKTETRPDPASWLVQRPSWRNASLVFAIDDESAEAWQRYIIKVLGTFTETFGKPVYRSDSRFSTNLQLMTRLSLRMTKSLNRIEFKYQIEIEKNVRLLRNWFDILGSTYRTFNRKCSLFLIRSIKLLV